VKGVFVELPAFERHRTNYLDDEAFRSPPQRQMLKRMIKAELEARRMS
jgi:hypothetical protein